ncbi:TIGR04282 family arsenosugar biosynthesis glycosyltransferase [Baekduia sp.]|uniref:TIGR04282 family arsenosugar biosynthesis glycosyltransferase n=1 Tax=Baekduia sp. TaxID=2600305 RepID=UPI002E06E204|nr:TIGR04282 family arsenosugar biosynthesis glycosyltransferase [Baekduia sp.]
MSAPAAVTLAVIAKAPVAGRVKTRLCPPCTPGQAADLAEAALRDTLAAMADAAAMAGRAVHRAIVLDGTPGVWLDGEQVIAQRGGGLDERLAAAFEDLRDGPALIVGMDTPQLTGALLAEALAALDDHDAVLGPATDGGYWGIGLRRADPRALIGVPMSVEHTLAAQRARLAALGLDVADAATLVDVDTIDDAARVAESAPATAFARAFAGLAIAA